MLTIVRPDTRSERPLLLRTVFYTTTPTQSALLAEQANRLNSIRSYPFLREGPSEAIE